MFLERGVNFGLVVGEWRVLRVSVRIRLIFEEFALQTPANTCKIVKISESGAFWV